jgi:HK97 family phage prohead protease
MNRAFVALNIKAIDDDARRIEGWATTAAIDRVGDVVMPKGAVYDLPLPFLLDHDSRLVVGEVDKVEVTDKGIKFWAHIKKIAEPGEVKDLCDKAWSLVKNGLRKAVSIGFSPLEYDVLPNGGLKFTKWSWLELSAVGIPANPEAQITNAKSFSPGSRYATVPGTQFDPAQPAASGKSVRLSHVTPPASGKSLNLSRPKEGQTAMKNVGEQIAALKEERKAKATALEAIQTKASGEGRTKDADERSQFNELRDELKSLDAEIADLEDIESFNVAPTAKQIPEDKKDHQPRRIAAEAPGLAFARLAKVKAVSRLDIVPQLDVAAKMYGRDSDTFHIVKAGEVAPGSNVSGNWAVDLVPLENGPVADFAEYLHERTILGRFGQGGIPALRRVSFRSPLVIQTEDGDGFWVGESKPKPVTTFDFDRTTLLPLKCANIAVLSMESIRDSSPASDLIVRDSLVSALVKVQDVAFIDPANNGTSGIKPISILYQAEAIVSEGDEYADVDIDLRSIVQKFINANNPLSSGVWVMSEGNAMALGMLRNELGQVVYSTVNMNGGTLLGLPVITSSHVGTNVALINAQDIHYGDDGEVTVDMSTEASLEMKTGTANMSQNPLAPGTGASLVSLWQNNLVGFRAEKTVNWRRRRASAAAYLTGVAWGAAVNIS